MDIVPTKSTFGMPSLCNLKLQKFSFHSIQTLLNDCPHIEDVHLLFCAHFMNIFFNWRMLNFDIFPTKSTFGVPSLCNLKLQKSSCPFIQTLHKA